MAETLANLPPVTPLAVQRIGMITTPSRCADADKVARHLKGQGFDVKLVVTQHGTQDSITDLIERNFNPDRGEEVDVIDAQTGDGTLSKIARATRILQWHGLPIAAGRRGTANDVSSALVKGDPTDLFKKPVGVAVRPLGCSIRHEVSGMKTYLEALGYIGFGLTGHGTNFIETHRRDKPRGWLAGQIHDLRVGADATMHAGAFVTRAYGEPYSPQTVRRELLVTNGPNMAKKQGLFPGVELWSDTVLVGEMDSLRGVADFGRGDMSAWTRPLEGALRFQTVTPVWMQADGEPLRLGDWPTNGNHPEILGGFDVHIEPADGHVIMLTDRLSVPV